MPVCPSALRRALHLYKVVSLEESRKSELFFFCEWSAFDIFSHLFVVIDLFRFVLFLSFKDLLTLE